MMYGYATTSLINNRSRVYKGGGWNDRSYWLSPARVAMDEEIVCGHWFPLCDGPHGIPNTQ